MTVRAEAIEYAKRAARTLLFGRKGHGNITGVAYRQMDATQLASLAACAWEAGFSAGVQAQLSLPLEDR